MMKTRSIRPATPWGIADQSTTIAPGIVFHSTPSHGGFHISPDKLASMDPVLRALPAFCGRAAVWAKGWYEEDCDAALIPLAFPADFAPDRVRDAIDAARACTYWSMHAAVVAWLDSPAGAATLARADERDDYRSYDNFVDPGTGGGAQ